MAMDFQQVMHDAKQLPLDIYFDFAPMTEPLQTKGLADVPEHWFHYPQPSTIQVTTANSVESFDHLARK